MGKKRNTYITYSEKFIDIDFCNDEANKFIQKHLSFSKGYAKSILRSRNNHACYDLAESSAHDGCFKAFILSKRNQLNSEQHEKAMVARCVKFSLNDLLIIFGYMPSPKTKFFPNGLVSYNEYFKYESYDDNIYENIDVNLIFKKIENLNPVDMKIHKLKLMGYSFDQINEKLGKTGTYSSHRYSRSIEKIKKMIEHPELQCKYCNKKIEINGKKIQSKFCSSKCKRKSYY